MVVFKIPASNPARISDIRKIASTVWPDSVVSEDYAYKTIYVTVTINQPVSVGEIVLAFQEPIDYLDG